MAPGESGEPGMPQGEPSGRSESFLAQLRNEGVRIGGEDETLVRAVLDRLHAVGECQRVRAARDAAQVLASLRLDADSMVAALFLGMDADEPTVSAVTGARAARIWVLMDGARRMQDLHALLPEAQVTGRSAIRTTQVERLRKMVLAMAQDGRVVVVHLAFQLVRLRQLVKEGAVHERLEAARETFELLAPLANRLGIWQVKWELEDLAFRVRDPDRYHEIARQLDEKRADREEYLSQVSLLLRQELADAGLLADVSARPKHIHSIWRKMQRKGLGFSDLSDVRGVRILVDEVKDCYAALGVVHNLWVPIPREFDDYIARPKANRYRSLHTAVIGPGEKVLEVQIRTHEMHQANELGVAAHWRYKEGGRRDDRFGQHVAWLRQVLDWRPGSVDSEGLAESFRAGLLEDTVYVVTPLGQVIALPAGSTPIDFAYHVHSDLGHRCRGARVNGRIVPLTHRLANGDRVEITSAHEGGPSLDWLNPARGFLRSARARGKVRQWFNNRNLEQSVSQGRQVLEREAHRLGVPLPAIDGLAEAMEYSGSDDLLAAIGRGEIGQRALQAALRGRRGEQEPGLRAVTPPTVRPAVAPARGGRGVLVVGVDRLLTHLARCCRPVPPDPIVGFVTREKGVSIHRADCPNVRQMPDERRLDSQWGAPASEDRFPADVEVVGPPEDLLRLAVDLLGRERVPVRAVRTAGSGAATRVRLSIEVTGDALLQRVMELLRNIPGVSMVRRC